MDDPSAFPAEPEPPCDECGGEGEVEECRPYYGHSQAYFTTVPCPYCREV